MTKVDEVNAFFKALSEGMDKVYDAVQGALDNAWTAVDAAFDEARKQAVTVAEKMDGQDAEPVKVEPDLTTKIKDIIAFRKSRDRQYRLWWWYLFSKQVPTSQNDIDYLNSCWREIPENERTWVTKNEHSPL